MTTTDHGPAPRPPAGRRRRTRQAPAARALVTGAACTATGLLVALMGAGPTAPSTTAAPALAPITVAPGAAGAPPTSIVVVHRPATATTPPVGAAVAAPRPARVVPAPAATSTAS